MLLVQLMLAMLTLLSGGKAKEAYLVVQGERITVEAATSLGSINCTYTGNRSGDTLYINKQTLKGERLVLSLPVKDFGCGNLLLNRDFQRTLKAGNHPLVRVEVLELTQQTQQLIGTLRLQLAGKTQVLRGVRFCNQPGQKLSTTLCLSFSDYELATPNKLGGLVKVEEELQVKVELLLAQQSNITFK
ncbi:hypothetical protein [Pontibacter cellulosilyticus]|uniref:YceI family protein n=1 Tax=Pontibacter cellulosilyticus TaxID=1720253 RepID=A0A923SNT9_9BACT|nr:hypothetical protein [Pontibacter cellulosilyticus]MBC5993520.1 hypothetical protein [Pontibacter cellulosilyticus]